jgi:hypothetical protein
MSHRPPARDCFDTRRALPTYLDGEADPLEALEIASHLSSCGGCSQEASRGRKVLSSLRDLELPSPPRDIAENVLTALRRARASLGSRAALKWSSLGLLAGLLLLPGIWPETTALLGLRFLTRLGELVDPEAILSGILSFLPGLVPSLTGFLDTLRDGAPSLTGAEVFITYPLALASLLLATGFVLAFLSGGLVFEALRSTRVSGILRKNRSSGSFDNPQGLP